MKLSQYNYSFSPDMLAKYPAESRDESRLMVLNRRTGKIEHKVFKEMIDYFRQGDVLVFNDTKVFPARLYGNKEKTGSRDRNFPIARAEPRPAPVGRAGRSGAQGYVSATSSISATTT